MLFLSVKLTQVNFKISVNIKIIYRYTLLYQKYKYIYIYIDFLYFRGHGRDAAIAVVRWP